MKKTLFLLILFAAALLCLNGCFWPRYGSEVVILADTEAPEVTQLTAEAARKIIDEAIANPPAGHHPDNPGWLKLGRWATEVRLREHTRTGLILVEVMDGKRQIMDFYVHDMTDARRFANALWRAKLEAKTTGN